MSRLVLRTHAVATVAHQRFQHAREITTNVGLIIGGAVAIIGGVTALLAMVTPDSKTSE